MLFTYNIYMFFLGQVHWVACLALVGWATCTLAALQDPMTMRRVWFIHQSIEAEWVYPSCFNVGFEPNPTRKSKPTCFFVKQIMVDVVATYYDPTWHGTEDHALNSGVSVVPGSAGSSPLPPSPTGRQAPSPAMLVKWVTCFQMAELCRAFQIFSGC